MHDVVVVVLRLHVFRMFRLGDIGPASWRLVPSALRQLALLLDLPSPKQKCRSLV